MNTDAASPEVRVARVRVMYWKEVPALVQGEDSNGRVPIQLDHRFQAGIDAVAMFDGSAGSDAYLGAWEWGPYAESAGTASEAAQREADRINSNFPRDFVTRIRCLERSGSRTPSPGAMNGWMEE